MPGAKDPILPPTSSNRISGSWSPAKISTASVGTTSYTFTPATGQCADAVTVSILVRSCSAATRIISPKETESATILDAIISPNPFHNQFTLTIKGNHSEIAKIRVFDILGRPIQYLKAYKGESVRFGVNYINGIYLVEVSQGTARMVLKAIKQ